MLRYDFILEHIENDLATCEKATQLAEEFGDPAIIAETRAIRGYTQMVQL